VAGDKCVAYNNMWLMMSSVVAVGSYKQQKSSSTARVRNATSAFVPFLSLPYKI
jgi:hypothetical protein